MVKRLNGTERFKGTNGKEYTYGDTIRFHYTDDVHGEHIIERSLTINIAKKMLKEGSLSIIGDDNVYEYYIFISKEKLAYVLDNVLQNQEYAGYLDRMFTQVPSMFTAIATKILGIAIDSIEEGHISECKTLYTINPTTGTIEGVKPNAPLYLHNAGYFRSIEDAKMALEVLDLFAYYENKKTKRDNQ